MRHKKRLGSHDYVASPEPEQPCYLAYFSMALRVFCLIYSTLGASLNLARTNVKSILLLEICLNIFDFLRLVPTSSVATKGLKSNLILRVRFTRRHLMGILPFLPLSVLSKLPFFLSQEQKELEPPLSFVIFCHYPTNRAIIPGDRLIKGENVT